MKIVINKCFGGFGLSPKAVKRLAELQGKECYFFDTKYEGLKSYYVPNPNPDASLFFSAFSVKNPNEYLGKEPDIGGEEMKEHNRKYGEISLYYNDIDRTDKFLIQVVEELGSEAASGSCAELEIIEIPDHIEYEIDEYDGLESVHEKHRSWS